MRRAVAAVAALLALATVLVGAQVGIEATVGPAPAGATTTSTTMAVTSARGLLVDPSTGRVFVAGDDAVDVFAPDGSRLTTVTGVPGAGGLDIAGSSLWVTSGNTALVEIDLAALAVVRTVPMPLTIEPNLVVVGTTAFVRMDNPFAPGADAVLAVDLVTGAWRGIPGFNQLKVVRAAGVTDRVFVVGLQFSWQVRTISTTSPYPVLAETPATTALPAADAQVSPDGTTAWVGVGGNVLEVDLGTGQTLRSSNVSGSLRSLAHSPVRDGLLGAATSTSVSYLRVGVSGWSASLVPASTAASLVAFSNDATTLWRAVGNQLEQLPVAPSFTGLSPTSSPSGQATRISVTGELLDGTTSVTVGGVAGIVRSRGRTSLGFDVPTSVPMGTHAVVIANPLGDLTTSLTLTAPIGTLTGKVRVGGAARAGVEVTLSGPGLTTPRTSTTTSSGTYTFTGLASDVTYRLQVPQPTGAGSGQVVDRVAVVGNGSATVDVDLRAAPTTAVPISTTELPGDGSDPVGSFLTDPVTGRTFVQKGAELLALDPVGNLVGRARGFGAPKGIAAGDGSVFVASAGAGPSVVITRIDPATVTVTGSWSLAVPDTAGIVHAGHQLLVLDGVGGADVRVLDLGTGALGPSGDPGGATAVAPVSGDPDRLLVATATELRLVSAAGPALSTVASVPATSPLVAADGPSNLLWADDGTERVLDTLAPTGRTFAATGRPTFSAARGGVVAFGPTVVSLAAGGVSHSLGAGSLSGLASTGDRAFVPAATGDLSVHDLTPHALAVATPPPIFATGDEITVTGWGLRATGDARVDGVSVAFDARSETEVDVSATATPGPHQVTLTTPWGTTDPISFEALDVPDPATVTAVTPSSIPVFGGPITLTGTDFTWATSIDVGGATVTSFTVVDDSTITLTAPSHVVGAVPVRVDTLVGPGVPGATLTYTGQTPAVTSMSPTSGVAAGGTWVTVRGIGFLAATAVTFDGVPATTFTVYSDTSIRARTPAHALGTVDVRVITLAGTSVATAASRFSYVIPAPAVSSLSPTSGPTLGGTAVTIKGARFTGATSVRFGSTEAFSFTVVDDSTIVATAPPRPLGTVNVIVTTPWGSDVAVSWNRFTYAAKPTGTLTGVVRDLAGPAAGRWVLVSPTHTPMLLTWAVPAADGSFSLTLPEGAYALYTIDPKLFLGLPPDHVAEWYQAAGPGAADLAGASPVAVVASTTTALAPIVLDHVAPGSITGSVRSPSGPLADALVLVSPASDPSVSAFAVTAADGSFSVAGLAPGSYKVRVVDGAVALGAPARYVAEWWSDLPDGPGAFEAATPVAVSRSAATPLAPIVLAAV